MTHFNKLVLRKKFNQVAETYQSAAMLYHEVGQRLLEHLDWIRLSPGRIIDLGASTGYITQLLKKRYPYTQIFAIDFAQTMLRRAQESCKNEYMAVCADAAQLPFANESIDLVISNLMLPWCDDLRKIFAEIWRVLKPGGMLLFSTFGPDTLGELRASWATVDDQSHVHLFFDLHDVGDVLLQQKFSEPVMQTEWLTFMYENADSLFADLKNTGAVNLLADRRMTLTGKNRFQQFLTEYQTYQDKTGKLPATFEIIYGHCWKPDQVTNVASEIAIPINTIKRKN